MINWEDDTGDHSYTIGTREEILAELKSRLKESLNASEMTTGDWRDYIQEMNVFTSLMEDIDNNAERGHLIALTPDTPSGELEWYYVTNIEFDD